MFEDLAKELAQKLAEEIDEELPDGVLQKVAGEAIKIIGAGLQEAGTLLATPEHDDGDE